MRNIVAQGQMSGSRENTVLSGCSARQALHHVDLGGDRDHRARGRVGDPILDPLRRAHPVGDLDEIVRALGVHDHLHVGVLGPGRLRRARAEALVHRAVALPQEQRRVLDVALLEVAAVAVRVPHAHVGVAEAHVETGVAAEVLVGEEEDLVAALERPRRAPPARSKTCRPRRRAGRRTPSARRPSSCR